MKKILLLLFVLTSLSFYAQLDREHWFAPMYDGQFNDGGHEQFLHLSTNETTPFNVYVYNNNNLIYQKTISKGTPGVIDIPRDYIITKDFNDVLIKGTRGLYVKADKPCFANLRFGVTNHTEIITSKGTAGIGTQFYTVVAPNTVTSPYYGFSASFLATEDNTTVTVNNFKKVLTFTPQGNFDHLTFTLNKGESYIIDGRTFFSLNNRDGFIGALVTSDKPVSMTNGNFNGQYAAPFANGSDILMDQSVPVNQLGDEFVIVKGYGKIGDNMEGAIIVATEPNTAIYLNGETTPTKILASPGDYEPISETNYVPRGNGHYNLHIKTDKNVYVYQLLGGVEGGTAAQATGGMNYIPPLNCYLPRKIDEISYIDRLSDQVHVPPFQTKLNIITERGATVKVNGVVPDVLYGPYQISTIPEQQNWVTYSIPNVTGNIMVESTKAVTAGIASGNEAFGYGGYFAGFSKKLLVQNTQGTCLQNTPPVKIEVTEGFDNYLWLMKVGNDFVPAPVNSQHPSRTEFEYYPQQAGIYKVEVQQGTCPNTESAEYPFYNCIDYTNYDYNTCESETIPIKFALSSQTLDPATIVELKAPDQGIADYTSIPGSVIYTANPTARGTDTFKFSFEGTGTPPDREVAQITIHLKKIEKYDAIITECSATTTAKFNLPLANITPDTTVSKTYYRKANFTDEILPTDIANYTSASGFVYVKLKNSFGCEETAIIELKVTNYLVLSQNSYSIPQCDNDLNDTENINLDLYKDFFTTDADSVKYFDDPIKAQNNLPGEDISASQDISGDKTFYYRFTKTGFCDVIGTLVVDFKQPIKSESLADQEICPDPNAKATLNVEADFEGNVVWSTGEISTSIEVGVGEHWADLTFNGCVYRQFVSVTALDIKITNIEIKGSTVTVSVTGGKPPYQYAMDNLNYQPSNVFTNVRGGNHTIYVISADNCIPIFADINVIEAYNVITPNGDGFNDVLNYSDLLKKEEPFFHIFDRNGKTIFTGDNNNKYSWDGKSSGKTVSTGSYWYIMKWREPGSTAFSEFSGWILVKNRD